MTVVDAHVHLWDPALGYPWLETAEPGLRRVVAPYDARAELDAAGVDEAILVQADDTAADTDRMLAAAAAHPWIVGVVGWLPLTDPEATTAELERRTADPRFRGVRHLVHFDPRAELLDLPEVRTSLARVAAAGLPLDVPDAWPRHLDQATRLAAALPELVVVIDHLAKPPFGTDDFDAWRQALTRAAALPNVVAKASGLHAAGRAHEIEIVRPAWEVALEAFGPGRLMYGSDWPMTAAGTGYGSTWAVLSALIGELSAPEREAVLAGTARRVYRLPHPTEAPETPTDTSTPKEAPAC